jgi:hypothetical protein
MTFYDFPQTLHPPFGPPMPSRVSEASCVSGPTRLTCSRAALSCLTIRLGDDPGYSTAKSPGGRDRVLAKGGAAHNST